MILFFITSYIRYLLYLPNDHVWKSKMKVMCIWPQSLNWKLCSMLTIVITIGRWLGSSMKLAKSRAWLSRDAISEEVMQTGKPSFPQEEWELKDWICDYRQQGYLLCSQNESKIDDQQWIIISRLLHTFHVP